ncbi:XRE family transcriptional regulator [Streptomyces sp. NPDC096152]|uniref:XRE family transcriptional regulator n=1 Tax=Streptomyces sp. NPDC096152 TaxID=3366078 RepID=UPI00381F7893
MRPPHAALTETLRRVDALLLKSGRTRSEVLDADRLSWETGVPAPVVAALLGGQDVPEEGFGERIRTRILHLRRTHRRPDGSRYSYSEIGASFGASGAAISAIVNGRSKCGPLAATQAGIEKFFFGQANGFLSAEAVPALNAALQPVLGRLEHETDPLAEALSRYDDVRGVALRQARDLPEERWNVLNATLKALLELDVKEGTR